MATPTTVSTDQSSNLKLKYRKGEGRSFTFEFVLDSAAYDISGYVFEFAVREIGESSAVFTLTEDSGGGLTNGGAAGTLTVDPTDDQVDIDAKTYEYTLKVTSPATQTWFHGQFVINDSPQAAADADSATVELDLGDNVVEVEVLIGGFDVENLSAAQKAALWAALAPYSLGES